MLETNPDKFIQDIEEFDRNFKEDEETLYHEKPTLEGLEKELNDIAGEEPQKVINVIDKFANIKSRYLVHIFCGLTFSKQNDIDIYNWEKLFKFIEVLIKDNKLLSKDKDYLLGRFAQFIKERFKDTKQISNATKLLKKISENLNTEDKEKKLWDRTT
ncbi:MAG: hypothetical protein LBL16_00225 [Endomicrobium sp.]|nr:hypothetical protein [Endomicrobium sp.]